MMILNPYRFSAAPPASSMVSLLHMNGADGSTTITDVTGKTWTRTGATIDTAQSVFGGASLQFASLDKITSTAHADFAFGTGQFTLEGRFRLDASAPSAPSICRFGPNWLVYIQGNALTFFNGGGNAIIGSTGININTWYAWAITRDGSGVVRLFRDGVLQGSASDTTNIAAAAIQLGDYNSSSIYFSGWQDEFRVSNTCLYTAGYTLATSEFPDS